MSNICVAAFEKVQSFIHDFASHYPNASAHKRKKDQC